MKRSTRKRKPTRKKTVRKKVVRRKSTKTGLQKPMHLSKELEAVVRKKTLSRSETVKKIWAYIKSHKLQDPDNRRRIIPDDKLAKVFGSKRPIDMMQLAGLMSRHMK